ncbi:FG-GAP repeat domain-containing protein [Streptomyces sp. NPDC099050]|uniref:FG-GAP repeat domain-containing protein n=1 Tax=Streptomyces sp. NPDC099050 TaxID=3366100 RepID=UPI00382AF5CD
MAAVRTRLKGLGLLLAAVLAAGSAQALPAAAAASAAATTTVPDGATVAPPLVPQDPSGYRLWYDASAKAATTALEQSYADRLAPVSLATVLDAADRVGRPATCPAPAKLANDGAYNSGASGFCWDEADTTTSTWIPQGITANATPFAPVDGRRVLAASWYKSGNTQVRVSFADTTDPARVRYVHVLLVLPGSGTFSALTGHGDDVVWYKNRLFVGFGQGFHVFDLNHLWKVNAAGSGMGRDASGTFSAENFGYVLPAVGTFSYQNPTGCGTYLATPSPNPCNAGASLDLSGATPAIITTEVTSRATQGFVGTGGKIVRWPLDPATGLPRTVAEGTGSAVRATAAWSSPIVGAQGVVSYNGTHLISAPCPEYVEWVPGGPAVEPVNSCVYRALPGQPVQLWKRASVHLQNMAYDPQRDALWLLNENQPQRVVYSIPLPRFTGPLTTLTATGDLTNDARPDLLAVDAAGKLWRYSGTGAGGYGPAAGLGGGWDVFTRLVGAGDLTGDGKSDLLAVDGAGQLWRYPGTGAGAFGSRVAMDGAWGAFTQLVGAGDLTGDGKSDLLAVDGAGQLWRYPGTGAGAFGSRVAMGGGWDVFTQLVGAGDLTGDGKSDLLAVDGAGQLWRYPGTGAGAFGSRVAMGGGWDVFTQLVGAGDLTGDGKPDLLARERADDGRMWLYPGTGTGGFGTRVAWTF